MDDHEVMSELASRVATTISTLFEVSRQCLTEHPAGCACGGLALRAVAILTTGTGHPVSAEDQDPIVVVMSRNPTQEGEDRSSRPVPVHPNCQET